MISGGTIREHRLQLQKRREGDKPIVLRVLASERDSSQHPEK